MTHHRHVGDAGRPALRRDGGFTLIELLVVVVIIGVLIAIAIPLYLNYQKSSNDKATQSDLRHAVSALETCNSDNSGYPSADATWTTSGSVPCTNQKINVSAGTTLKYYASGTSNYLIVGYNANGATKDGASKYYCYASKAGGSVALKTGAVRTAYNDAC